MAEQPFLHQAEDTGIPAYAAYHKVFIGAAQMGLMPKPIAPPPGAERNTLTFRRLGPVLRRAPLTWTSPFESYAKAVEAAAGQLRQMGEFLTQQTGLPLDQRPAGVGRSQRTMALYHRGLHLRAGRQVLSDLTSELLAPPPSTSSWAPGDRGLCPAAAPGDHHRSPRPGQGLLWIHTTPYWVAPLRHLFAQSTRVQVAACDMSYEGIVEADPTKPYGAWPAA